MLIYLRFRAVNIATAVLLACVHGASQDLKERVERANKVFAQGDLDQAERIFQAVEDDARRQGNDRFVVIGLNGIGAVYAREFRFKDGFAAWLKARDFALSKGLKSEAGAILSNLASLYLQLENLDAAEAAARQCAEITDGIAGITFRAQIRLAMAGIRARQKNWDAALGLFYEALAQADESGDERTLALVRNNLGYELIRAGRIQEAERPLSESFRWRLLHNSPDLFHSYLNLGELELRRGDYRLALNLGNRAFAIARKQSVPLAPFRYLIARILVQSGKRREAAEQFRAAIDEAWRLRLDLLPADQFRIGAEFDLSKLYEDALENAASMAETGLGSRELERVWIAAGERRAYLLKAAGLTPEQLRDRLPSAYWSLLARYRRLEAEHAALTTPASEGADMQRLRVQLTELESSAGIKEKFTGFREKIEQITTLYPFRSRLSQESALISYQLGETRSHRWELTANGFHWSPLPGRRAVDTLAKRFYEAVRDKRPEAAELGLELNRVMFGGMKSVTNRAGHWMLDLDGELFGAPLAAVVSSTTPGGPHFLVEDRTLRIVPGAWSLLLEPAHLDSGKFLAIADAVYNRADSRKRDSSAVSAAAYRGKTSEGLEELPSLPGSRLEAESCARIWESSTVLTGWSVNRFSIEKALEFKPGVVHVATHVLQSPSSPERALLALSLDESGRIQYLGTTDVASLPTAGALVVLSGCHSAAGKSLPGAGWMGMTRAWLLSGASGVIASQWPTLDDSGLLFHDFYRELRSRIPRINGTWSQTVAVALRESQLKMLRSKTWRAHPNYWATYQLTVKTQ